jgi:opacity protein-like surface antigen
MKTIPLLLLGFAIPAIAGTSAKETVTPGPAPDPCLFTWFAGGSVGYLTELEEPMYHLHIGTDTCWNLGGWDVALFLEVGYTEKDDSWRSPQGNSTFPPNLDDFDGDLDDIEDFLKGFAAAGFGNSGYDLDIIPITFNVKLERPLTGNLNAYFGGGLGMALVDFSAKAGLTRFSDDDWVFVGQLFAGLNYNFNPNFEMYGGVRWIYFDDAGLSDGGTSVDLELDDDFLLEIGARFNF